MMLLSIIVSVLSGMTILLNNNSLTNYVIGIIIVMVGLVLSFMIKYSDFTTYTLSTYISIFIGYQLIITTM